MRSRKMTMSINQINRLLNETSCGYQIEKEGNEMIFVKKQKEK